MKRMVELIKIGIEGKEKKTENKRKKRSEMISD